MSPGEDDEPHNFYFETGWVELIVDILQRLSIKCGPFVLFAGDEKPKLIGIADSS
jgi:hypothetical protein